ncbi:DNA replication protein [Paenibacillus sp. YN15]|uniref:DNA replication protein n=1 Tax=Paenibacillus sp. YN15 TaxID=1742774 RepID=UPI002852E6CD|nr:DNA replication protein [Paenibacillus sp. YN15]
MGSANVPAEYRMLTLATSPAREAQAIGPDNEGCARLYRAYNVIERYVATFPRMFAEGGEGQRIKSLYLYSAEPGTGKTTTAAAILAEFLIVHYVGSLRRGLTPAERPAYFLDVNAWQTLYNGFNRSNVPQATAEPIAAEYYAVEERAKTSAFAVLDDIGVRSATEAFRADLHGIINYRVANGLPTVYTSNVPMAELSSVFDARLADRIRDMTAEIEFSGQSRRGMR